jgi:hypothetical protein
MIVNGRIEAFCGDLLHFPYRCWRDHLTRVDRYTELAAQAARYDGRSGSLLKLALAPPAAFMRSFIAKAGFLDGWRGLLIAYMAARYVLKRELRILR